MISDAVKKKRFLKLNKNAVLIKYFKFLTLLIATWLSITAELG